MFVGGFILSGRDRVDVQIEQRRRRSARKVHLEHPGLLRHFAAGGRKHVDIFWIDVAAGLEPAPESPVKDQDQ